MSTTFRTKQGEHGTLYLFRVIYCDTADQDNDGESLLWAYDKEHAEERFYDTPDDGWRILSITRPRRK